MEILRSKYLLITGVFIAAYLPFSLLTISVSSNWWINYFSWMAFFMQSFLMVTAGLLTYRAAFHKKVLGGLIGTAIRIFSIGLLVLGLGLTQIPFIQAYNLWQTPYVTTGIYFIPYVVGSLSLFVSLLVGRWGAITKLLHISGAVCMVGIFIRLILGKIPLQPNTFFTTVAEYQQGITIDATIFILIVSCIAFSVVHQQMTQSRTLAKMYRLQAIAFAWYLIPAISDFFIETVPGWGKWYTYSFEWNVLFAGSLLLASVFFYRLGLFIYELRP